MAYYWLFIICSWIGSASLQHISSDIPSTDEQPPLNYNGYQPSQNDFNFANDEPILSDLINQYYQRDDNQMVDLKRNRRMVEYDNTGREAHWHPTEDADAEKAFYGTDDDKDDMLVIQNISNFADENLVSELEKRNFSPWGGKRAKTDIERMWTWKRTANIREPNMPKRVRFSPWGGKRSGQMVYKSGTKGAKFIFSTSIPELTRVVTNYSPNSKRLDLRGFQFVPSVDKSHPIKILALSTKLNDRTLRETLPYKSFIESLPRAFKPGHTYSGVTLKTDGKRKVKFSAWGGKRSPPIIGPIWTPAPQNVKESTLDAILVIRNNPGQSNLVNNQHQI